ncbi:apolipoprotein N-acyltransferase [Sulfurovum sp. bin170]|uniref:apolipoprotein N-acyltransferase n=1 Tax=Sulfurovum sp. bin170 TaxID=2695268 RepID=UPI0013E09DA2|nr:apolipoprotein N-acyltransferase [Sulfurovum sp. bin170]NEW60197.1 apolipoprotein N-acyltransferase [Sulfurovum sp. bin170]
MSIKIIEYFTIKIITTGFVIAILSSGAMYLDWLGFVNHFVNTILGILMLYWLLQSDKKVWFWGGFWIGGLWFWWMSVSFFNYGFAWAIPLGVLFPSLVYGFVFWIIAKIAEIIGQKIEGQTHGSAPTVLVIKALALLALSYLHPLGFDWFKPELIFTNSYLGIEKWQFAIVLFAISMTIYKQGQPRGARLKPSVPYMQSICSESACLHPNYLSQRKLNPLLYLLLIILAYPFSSHFDKRPLPKSGIVLSNSMTTVEDKWKPELQPLHVDMVFKKIDRAIAEKKGLIIFPESIFAFYLNTQPNLMTLLQGYSNEIAIVIGGLYWDDGIPRNSTYIFKDGKFSIANKAVLVPFGEQNPLPKWMGKIVNEIFFDGAPDYVASDDVTDYSINGITYRNAICYEGSSEKLYKGDPKQMILISNNGWVTPSIEPTQQKILLQYYSKKYGTTIYHSANMSASYTVHNGEVIK